MQNILYIFTCRYHAHLHCSFDFAHFSNVHGASTSVPRILISYRVFSMVSHPRQKSTFYFQHNFFNCNTTFCFQHNFLFSTQLFIFKITFYFQHNFLFSTQLFIFNTTFLICNTTFCFQHNFLFSTQLFIFNFFSPTAIHSCHVSRARTFFEKSCKNVVKL
jgi:hypothetical protein